MSQILINNSINNTRPSFPHLYGLFTFSRTHKIRATQTNKFSYSLHVKQHTIGKGRDQHDSDWLIKVQKNMGELSSSQFRHNLIWILFFHMEVDPKSSCKNLNGQPLNYSQILEQKCFNCTKTWLLLHRFFSILLSATKVLFISTLANFYYVHSLAMNITNLLPGFRKHRHAQRA